MGKSQTSRKQSDRGAPPTHTLHLWQFQAVRDLVLIGSGVGLVWAGHALSTVTVPLLVALLLAYLFDPIINWLCKHPRLRMSRMKAVLSILVPAGAGVLILLALILPLAIAQTSGLISNYRDGSMRGQMSNLIAALPGPLQDDFGDVLSLFPEGAGRATTIEDRGGSDQQSPDEAGPAGGETDDALSEDRVREIIRQEIAAEARTRRVGPELSSDAADWSVIGDLRERVGLVTRLMGGTVKVGLIAFLIPFYFFFFSIWYPAVVRFGRSMIPERNKKRALELLGRMDQVVSGFVRGRIIISIIMGILLAIGWWICGVPYAILIGLTTGVFCAVPYLGLIGIPLAVGPLFIQQLGLPPDEQVWLGEFGAILWPTLVFGVVQAIEGYLLTPMIAGKATNLDPVTIIVAVLAGGSIMGIYGMLLAIPVAACGKIMLTDVLMPKINAWLKGERKDPLPIGDD